MKGIESLYKMRTLALLNYADKMLTTDCYRTKMVTFNSIQYNSALFVKYKLLQKIETCSNTCTLRDPRKDISSSGEQSLLNVSPNLGKLFGLILVG